MQPTVKTLSWEKNPLAELLRMAWPIATSMVSFSAMTLVDTLFVGHLGRDALAGLGQGGVTSWAILCFAIGLLRGVKVLVSQALGAGQHHRLGAYLGAGVAWAGVLGLGAIGLGMLAGALLPHMAATASAGHFAQVYLRIRILAAPMILIHAAVREFRYGLGDSQQPMRATIAGNVTNALLAWLFIRGFGWGVAGAGFATLVGHGVEMSWLLFAQRGSGYKAREVSRAELAAVWRIGVPTGIQFLMEMGAFSILAFFIAAISEVHMAAHQIALNTIMLSFLPALAVAEAASVLAGQAVGANRDDLVRPLAHRAAALTGAYTLFCTGILVLFARWIAARFTDDPAVAQLAVRLLGLAALFQIADGLQIVARGVLRGTGDVRVPAAIGIVTAWLVTPPMMWLLGYRAGLGAYGGWIGLCIEIFVGAAIFWWRLERRHWQRAAVRSRKDLELSALPTQVAA